MSDHPNAPGNSNRRDDAREPDNVSNPAGSALTEPTLAVDLVRVELDQAVATAHRFPRKLDAVMAAIEQMALYDDAAADRCVYSLPRAGKAIVGPSIGFANILASAWGNCRDGARWVRTDRAEKAVVCEGAFFDLQANRQIIVPAVRRISGNNGRIYSDDMIIVTAQAAASIARRNAILQGVPRPLWNPIYERALIVVRGTEATLPERRAKTVSSFAAFGIEPKRLFAALGVKAVEEINLDHIVVLRGMYEALKDGTTTPEEMFDPRRMTSGGFAAVENPMGDEGEDERAGQQPGAPSGAQGGAGAQQPAGGQAQPAQEQPDEAKVTGADQPGQQGAQPQPGEQQNPGAGKAAPAKRVRASRAKPKPEGAQPAGAAAPAAQPAQPDPKPAQEQPKAAQAPAVPKTSEQYVAHALAYIAAATGAAELENKWKGERQLRSDCMVVEDAFNEVNDAYRARLAELRKG